MRRKKLISLSLLILAAAAFLYVSWKVSRGYPIELSFFTYTEFAAMPPANLDRVRQSNHALDA
jgi:hypothetical protein